MACRLRIAGIMSRDANKLTVFKLADGLVLDVYRSTKSFPAEERYGLQAQIRRAAVSAPSNIVEGCARRSTNEYLNFLNIAAGSVFEARYLLDLSFRLGFLAPQAHATLIARYTHLAKSMVRLIESLGG